MSTFHLAQDADFESAQSFMKFRLTYEGPLLGSSRSNSRADHKHDIRRVFHKQLKRLWEITPQLNRHFYNREDQEGRKMPTTNDNYQEYLADKFSRCGYRFVPLVPADEPLSCSLHILFLRDNAPGSIFTRGDIDGRLKTIFDGLKMVRHAEELGKHKVPEPDENPFYCLLEDDSLIANASVETDSILEPITDKYSKNDARLIITVDIKATLTTFNTFKFGG